ncbi:MAG: beta-galactosidase [Candidatus Gastranaerophilales bacterium]|nr:beta-galactosidase [Candidatus Gastranaerophilales bacterium]
MQITFDKNSLIIDGKRVFIKSGAFHYFRTPGVELAKDRFMKLKAAGYNTVDIYFNANYHSKNEHEYDFSGIKDVRKVLETAKEVGLFIIARPGPFINAEVNAGGIPYWVLRNKDVIPRNRIGTEYHYSPEYMAFVREWYGQIIPIIKDFDNVIAFQIENEYATDEMDEGYMKELYNMARELGITCPVFHNDAYNAGLWAELVDIYACDIYPYINPNQNWKQDHFCFDTIDNIEDTVRSFKEDAPIFIAEMQGGWFDKWDGIGYPAMRAALGDEHINIMTKTAVSQGVTMFNHYMAIGGTSWDDLACDEVYTSYDFCSGIDEMGNIQPNFYKAKEINYFLNSFGLTNTGERENLDLGQDIYAVRRKDYENNCNWLFVRNMNSYDVGLESPTYFSHFTFHISPYDMKIMLENFQLNACKIVFSDVEIFARIKNEKDEILFMISDENANMYLEFENTPHPNPLPQGERGIISGKKRDYEFLKYEKHGKTTQFLFISRELANRTWVLGDKVIFNADFVYSNGRIALSKTTEVAYFDLVNGFSKKYFKFQERLKTIMLKDFEVSFCAPEIDTYYDYSDWTKVSEPFDSLSCGMYDEFVWYKTKIPDYLEEITLSARHLFAVYINGKEVLNRNSYKYEKLQQIEETISIPLNKTILTKEQNELTVLVQNLGFDKGFSGDTNHPRGLVEFSTKPERKLDFYVREGLSLSVPESESPYMAKLSTNFNVELKENVVFSKYLSLKDFPYDRATIFLNGVKVGRYLKNNKNCSLQENFYLINTFLKPQNTLDIVIWDKASNIKTPWDFKNELKHVIMQVEDERIHQLY